MLTTGRRGPAFVSVVAFLSSQLLSVVVVSLIGHSQADLCRWDCNWYRIVLEGGYDLEPVVGSRSEFANWGIWPALPMLGRLINWLTGIGAPLALVVAGRATFAVSIYSFVLFCTAWRPGISPWIAAMVAAFQPYAIYGNVGYTEPLFLAVTCTTLILARDGRAVLAGAVAGMGTLVRFPVLYLGPALALRFWLLPLRAGRLPSPHGLLAVMLAPLGIAFFSLYLAARVGDGLAFFHVQRAWNRGAFDPLGTLVSGLLEGATTVVRLPEVMSSAAPLQMLRELGAHRGYYAVTALAAIFVIGTLVRRREFDLAVFSLGATLTPLATNLASMPRYVWWQAPLLLCVASAVSTRRWAAIAYFIAAAVATPITYAGWFSNFGFVT